VPALLGSVSSTELAKCLQLATELIRRFVGKSQVRSLIVQKLVMEEQEEGEEHVSYVVLSEVHYVNPRCQSVQLIKDGGIVESDKPFNSQLRVISLSGTSPYMIVHAFFSNSLPPYLK
jgi:hypothetical protein